jgi:7-cyano-7-deazaguanine synthase
VSENKKALAVVLVSGGMDSCVVTSMAADTYRLACLHVNYGQRTERRELACFHELIQHYNAEKALVVDLPHLGQIGGSSLTDPKLPITPSDSSGRIPPTYVPFRNANLLCVAVSWAEIIGATKILIGAVEQDAPGYPDCRAVFYKAFNELVRVGTRPETDIEVVAPLIGMTKDEIVRRGVALRAPFHLTWSCYAQEEVACGVCDSCLLRAHAFEEAGVIDPLDTGRSSR